MFQKSLKYLPQTIAMLFLAGFAAWAWQEPPAGTIPPDNNVEPPINVSASSQIKAGALGIGGVLRAFSDAIIDGKVGIGTDNPGEKLDVQGGGIKTDFLTIAGGTSLPLCDSSKRGKTFLFQGSGGIEDGLYICKKNAAGSYGWIALASPDIVVAKSWPNSSAFASTVNIWGAIKSGFPPVAVSDFSIPSDAKQWACSYTIDGTCSGSCCSSGETRVICGTNVVYSMSHGAGFGFDTSDMPIQSSSGVSCQVEVRSVCPSNNFGGAFGGNCYYVK